MARSHKRPATPVEVLRRVVNALAEVSPNERERVLRAVFILLGISWPTGR